MKSYISRKLPLATRTTAPARPRTLSSLGTGACWLVGVRRRCVRHALLAFSRQSVLPMQIAFEDRDPRFRLRERPDHALEIRQVVRIAGGGANLDEKRTQLCENHHMLGVRLVEHVGWNRALNHQGCGHVPIARDHPIRRARVTRAEPRRENVPRRSWMELESEPRARLAERGLRAELVQFEQDTRCLS